METHVHEVLVDSGVAADLGVGGMVPGLDVLLEGGAQEVDVFHHPVVGDGFPDVLLFGFGLEVGGELAQVHVVDRLGPSGDHGAAEGGEGFLSELGVEGFVYEGGGQIDSGIGGVVRFGGVDLDEEIIAALIGGDAVAGDIGGYLEGDIVDLVVCEGGQDPSQAVGELGAHQVLPYAGHDGVRGD